MQLDRIPMRHTVVVSDVHLWQALPGDGLWMRYRQRRYFPDDSIAAMFGALSERAGADDLEVVFNGDVFDFDVAPVAGNELDHGARCDTEEAACKRLTAILDDHPAFVRALGTLVREARSIVFVAGNHDVQLQWARVQETLVARIVAAAMGDRPISTRELETLRSRVRFSAWFHRTGDGIFVEHGNQYDRYCAFGSPLAPFVDDGTRVEPTVGSLVVHHIVGNLGYFNPNHDESFLLTGAGYARHFFRHYAFAPHSLVGTWTLGTLQVAFSLLEHRGRRTMLDEDTLARFAAERGLDLEALRAHAALSVPAGVHEFLRTLHLDKAALAGALAAATVVAVAHPPTAIGVAVAALGGLAAFNIAVQEKSLSETYDHVRQCQRRIAQLHNARAVVFGHTHEAYGHWENGIFYGNCGTWSPRHRDVECSIPHERGAPFVWLRSDDGERIRGGLYRFVEGHIFADARDERETLTPIAPAMPESIGTAA